MSNLFYCYSMNLYYRFLEEGLTCLGRGNSKTGKYFWIFEKSDKTREILKEWAENKPTLN